MTALRGAVAIGQLQVEGAADGSDWQRWEHDGRATRSQPTDFATRFSEHFAQLAESGIAECRFTLDWARIVPRAGRPDGGALEHVEAIVEAATAAGLGVWVGLHDVSLPGWFVDEGGFADDKARGRFWPAYVDAVAETVGDAVAGWFPTIAPFTFARRGYLIGDRPPGRRDPETHANVVRGVWLAWRDAWRVLRGGPPVATALDLAPVYRADNTVIAQQAARRFDDGTFGVAVSALRDGLLRVPGLAELEVPDLQNAFDVAGLTYAGAVALDGEEALSPYPPAARQPWLEGLGIVVRRLAEELPDRPMVVAGLPVPSDADERAEMLPAAVAVLDDARADGVDVTMLVIDAGTAYADVVWPTT
jgi:beta-glucosidase